MPVKQRQAAGSSHFGRIDGSPPGLPGGGMTCIAPPWGVGTRISGSMPGGGHSTPSDFASLSLNGSVDWPVVLPLGARVPSCGTACVGAQFVDPRPALDGAVSAGGVAGVGGACANAAAGIAASKQINGGENFIVMETERLQRADVPCGE